MVGIRENLVGLQNEDVEVVKDKLQKMMMSWICPEARERVAYGSLGLADGEVQISEDVRKALQGMYINLCMKMAEIIQSGNKEFSVIDLELLLKMYEKLNQKLKIPERYILDQNSPPRDSSQLSQNSEENQQQAIQKILRFALSFDPN